MIIVKIFTLYRLDGEINRHQLNSLKNEGESKIELIVPCESISKKEPINILEKKKWAYTLFVVHPPYSINRATRIHVFYLPWHQHCVISVMDIRHNISSGVSKILFWKSRVKAECNSSVIFLWDIKKKKRKNTQLSYWGMAYIPVIWYISESIYLSNCVFVNIHVAPDQSLYNSMR